MKRLDTLMRRAQVYGVLPFVRRAFWEMREAEPPPVLSAPGAMVAEWRWPRHSLTIWVTTAGDVLLSHPRLRSGPFSTPAEKESRGVTRIFYMMFDLLGLSASAWRVMMMPYKGP